MQCVGGGEVKDDTASSYAIVTMSVNRQVIQWDGLLSCKPKLRLDSVESLCIW